MSAYMSSTDSMAINEERFMAINDRRYRAAIRSTSVSSSKSIISKIDVTKIERISTSMFPSNDKMLVKVVPISRLTIGSVDLHLTGPILSSVINRA